LVWATLNGAMLLKSLQRALAAVDGDEPSAQSGATVGSLLWMTSGRVFDAVIDPVMGAITDRTRTRW
jgi:hypothetical protein